MEGIRTYGRICKIKVLNGGISGKDGNMRFYKWIGHERELINCIRNVPDDLLKKYDISIKEIDIDDNAQNNKALVNKLSTKIFTAYWKEPFCEIPFSVEKSDEEITIVLERDVSVYENRLRKKYNVYLQKKQFNEISKELEILILSIVKRWLDTMCWDIDTIHFMLSKILIQSGRTYYKDNYEELEGLIKESENHIYNYKFPILPINGYATYPQFGRELQNALYVTKRYSIFKDINKSTLETDITRYGFQMIDGIVQELNSLQKVEKIEDYILLDEILGVSLTNCIYHMCRNAKANAWDGILKMTTVLAQIQSLYFRNIIAKQVFIYLRSVEYNERLMNDVMEMLKNIIPTINNYIDDVLYMILYLGYKDAEEVANALKQDYKYFHTAMINKGMIKSEDGNIIANYAFMRNVRREIPYTKEVQRIKISKLSHTPKLKSEVRRREYYARIHQAVMRGIFFE